MYKPDFIFLLILIPFLFLSCHKENYPQLLRPENNKLASANGGHTILYSICTEKGAILDLYRDSEGFINISKERSGGEVEPHDIKLTIKGTNGTYPVTISYLSSHPRRKTNIKGPITVFIGDIILFEEGKNNTSPGAIYTIKSKLTSVDIQSHKKSTPPGINGKLPIQQRQVIRNSIVLVNNNPGQALSSRPINFVLTYTNGKRGLVNSDDVAKTSRLELANATLLSVSTGGIYLYDTAHKREKREMQNSLCRINATEELIYDINTESYPTPNPIGSGIFSIRRTIDGQIVIYQENASGSGNASVNYEITAKNYKIGTDVPEESRVTFNECAFSSTQKIDTKVSGLITVKRNGIVLFDESDEIRKKMDDYIFCITDFLTNPNSSSNSHQIVRRGLGMFFYPMPSDGSPLVLRVRFINGCPNDFRTFIINTVREWESAAHIRFDFLDDQSTQDAHIRIDVGTGLPNDDMTAYSIIGAMARFRPSDQLTMRLPLAKYRRCLQRETAADARRFVLHEFGHALGLAHEHQNPHRQFEWNTIMVYLDAYLRGKPQEKVNRQVLTTIDHPGASNSGRYDPRSIMNYVFHPSLTIGSPSCKPPTRYQNITNLSDGDKAFIATKYPKPTPAKSTESSKRPSSDDEGEPPHKKKPDYTDTTGEPPGPE